MRTHRVLQKFFSDSFTDIHAKRLDALAAAVDAVAQGAPVSITAMGRSVCSSTRVKHRIKRMDRLIGNRLLGRERIRFYRSITQRLLTSCTQPIILVDWSDFSRDRQQQLLRASLPVGGRAMTLYEELHPYDKLANRTVQHRFLDRLKTILPADCTPVIIADAGFRGPFFRYVQTLGWHWLGRIRNRDYICWEGAPYQWVPAKSVYAVATTRPQDLGVAQWVRRQPLEGRLILIRQPKTGRKDRTFNGAVRLSAHSRKQAKRGHEPWLLVASPSLYTKTAKQIVACYKTRMQIEENFRDTKSTAYGLGIANGRYTSFDRAANLLLIAALALFTLWIIGCLAKARHWDRAIRVNSSSRTASYSTIFLARLIIVHVKKRLSGRCFNDAGKLANAYLTSICNA